MITYNEICEKYTLPVVPLRGVVALPGVPISIEVGRPFSKLAVEMAQKKGSYIYLVAQKDSNEEEKIISNLEKIGVVAKIKQVISGNDGNLKVVFEGVSRAETELVSMASGYYIASVCSKIIEIDGYSKEKSEAQYSKYNFIL